MSTYLGNRAVAWTLTFMLLFSIASIGNAQTTYYPTNNVQLHTAMQLRFFSRDEYAHPYADVDFWCTFKAPSGKEYTVAGFWQSGRLFDVRFAPDETGEWTYTTSCNYSGDPGLHQRTGTFEVIAYDGDNPLYQHGMIRVAANNRTLAYNDGTPFYYLADAPWEIPWKSRINEVGRYLHDRKLKRFTAMQCVALSHQMMNYWGIINQAGSSAFEDSTYMEPHARYFDYLDSLVTAMNDSGFVVAMCPLWAWFSEPHNASWPYRMFHRAAMRWARYMAARYAGNNVIWIIAGDDKINTPQKVKFWDAFAMQIKEAGAWRQLCTCHPNGGSASFTYFPPATKWLDFHMYHSSHSDNNYVTYDRALEGWNLQPVKPVLNGEPAFEDIYGEFWNVNDTNRNQFRRLNAQNIRFAHYTSILNGSTAGTAYGADGVFQWSIPADTGSHYPRVMLDDAWALPGSWDVTRMRNFMEDIRWYNLSPLPEHLISKKGRYHVSIAGTDSLMVVYLPQGTEQVKLRSLFLAEKTQYQWFNPRTGAYSDLSFIPGDLGSDTCILVPPDTNDWVAVCMQLGNLGLGGSDPSVAKADIRIYPNPCNGYGYLQIETNNFCQTELTLYDSSGKEILRQYSRTQPGINTVEMHYPHRGVYLAVLRISGQSIGTQIITKKVLSY